MKIVDYFESNKQMGQACVSMISINPFKLQASSAAFQGGLEKRR